ncbi:NAD(P)/FAD-dependent oxidoreductase [Gimibacter soli]|uniref:FAD-dependent oxidoreductase n=1 Tax=Gimibacter soli TaxID=3024400 RepID=A0AAE9XVD0_9PROT|nr:FAD-dependent oxidoreductase [Gimibacter soli]WCL55535.1 FAD-dependent oxidoreductase [Gimibacter soli]
MTKPDQSFDVLIVGAGQAGGNAAIALRQAGFEGSIALAGEEPDAPYERPPLSKEYLSGEKPAERLALRPLHFWADKGVELKLGHAITQVDAEARTATDNLGHTYGWRHLIWATGGSPRPLSVKGAELDGIHSIRNRADVDALKVELPVAERIAVIGGGYIGLEAAAVLTKLGKKVTVLEAMDRVLARVTAEPVSRFFEDLHRGHGVDVRLGVTVDHLVGTNKGAISGVMLKDGTQIDCELVIVGIGILPAVAPLAKAGAKVGNGVEVDAFCRTSLEGVYAIGDCAAHENAFADGACIRLESVQNANDQARVVAAAITGNAAPYHAVPWFWSNQYDLRLQTVGLSTGYDATVLRGDVAARTFSLIYLKEGRVIALDCVGAVKDYVQGRALVEKGVKADPAKLADISILLKDLAV